MRQSDTCSIDGLRLVNKHTPNTTQQPVTCYDGSELSVEYIICCTYQQHLLQSGTRIALTASGVAGATFDWCGGGGGREIGGGDRSTAYITARIFNR